MLEIVLPLASLILITSALLGSLATSVKATPVDTGVGFFKSFTLVTSLVALQFAASLEPSSKV